MTGGFTRHAWRAGWMVSACLTTAAACTEDTLTGVDPDGAPGEGSPTIEIVLEASDLPAWRDTTFTDYALPATSSIRLVADAADLRARVLARFTTLPDSVLVDGDRVAVESFESARIRLVLDTLATALPEAGGSIDAHALARGFDDREANWLEAAEGEPWTTPGGDLGPLLGSLAIDSVSADTVFLPLVSVDGDSLLKSWLVEAGEPGIALSTDTDGARFTIRQVVLVFDAKPVGRDVLIETLRTATPSTFLFDPTTPTTGARLRLGGIPASRAYVSFELPETAGGVGLRGARINRATLLLGSTGPPAAPFVTADTLLASSFSLLSDPFEFGPKTPVGTNTSNPVQILPEDMVDGGVLELPITGIVQEWAAAEPGEAPSLNLGIRVLPEGGGLAYWEFGDAGDAARNPRVRIVLTPITQFDLP